MKGSVKKYIINILVIAGITVISLWFALKDNFHEIIDLISNISWYWLIIILLWGFIYVGIIGIIITILARRYKKDYTYLHGLGNALVGTFFCGITPSATGGQFGQAYVFKKQGIKYSDGASILWADFIVYQTTMMVYVTILFLLRFSYYMEIIGTWFLAIFVGYLVNIGVISVLWTMALFPRLYVKLSGHAVSLLAKLHIVKNKQKTLNTWAVQVEGFTKEIKELKHEKKMIIKTVIWNIIRMTVQFSLPFFIAHAIGINVAADKFVDSLALASFVLMANAFIPIPGASGGTELVFTQLFKHLVGSLKASSIMILWRLSTFHIVILIGACTFIYLKKKYDGEERKQKKEDFDIREVDS